MKSILDPTFRYTPSYDTDLRRTFARIRREPLRDVKRSARAAEGTSNVAPILPTMSKRR